MCVHLLTCVESESSFHVETLQALSTADPDMSAVQKVGGSDDSSSTAGSRPLNNEAVFRIELSFSSRRSSVIVMRCTARLYALEGAGQTPTGGQGKGSGFD